MTDDEPVTITCDHCGNPIVTVKRSTAEAFGGGTWACASRACYDKRAAARASAEGRLA